MKPKKLAMFMHETYERIAREEDWKTQEKTRVSWTKLPKENKKTMLRVAEEVLYFVPPRCPLWQCGGFMKMKERKAPKDKIEDEHYPGDFQTPDLVCDNCKGIYAFKGFKKRNET